MGQKFSRECPQCSRVVSWPDSSTYPFCSERCRLIDLGAWAQGDYRIPSEQLINEEGWLEENLQGRDATESDREP
ncbi:DNA gyrase inhibitor YacG [Candidatus Entotheonellaceae bacterium PAL068K]